MLEVVDDTLSVQEVHRRCQPIPVERLCESQPPGTTGDVRNRDYLLERDNLHRRDNRYDVYMPHEHCTKESAYHDERPYRSRDECRLLLLVLRWFYFQYLQIELAIISAHYLQQRTHTSVKPSPVIRGLTGDPGSDAPSLISEKLLLRPSALELCPFRWLNLMLRRGFAILDDGGYRFLLCRVFSPRLPDQNRGRDSSVPAGSILANAIARIRRDLQRGIERRDVLMEIVKFGRVFAMFVVRRWWVKWAWTF